MSDADRLGQEMEQWSSAVRDDGSVVGVPELDLFLLVNLAEIGAMRVVEMTNKDKKVRRVARWAGLRDVAMFCRAGARQMSQGGVLMMSASASERTAGMMAAALAVEIIQSRYGKYVGDIDTEDEGDDDE